MLVTFSSLIAIHFWSTLVIKRGNACDYLRFLKILSTGYVRVAKNLTQVMVRNAGHILPFDQPKWAFDMIQRFIQEKAFA